MEIGIIRVLLIEDDEDDYIITRDLFAEIKETKFDLEWVSTYDAAIEEIQLGQHDIYLIDYRLGERSGLELLRETIEKGCKAPMILLTGQGDHEIDVEAMKAGAADYLVKGQVDASSLERFIRYAIERKRAEEEIRKSEERYRDLFENANDLIQNIAMDGSIVYVNRAWRKTLGYDEEEIAGLSLNDVIHPDSKEHCMRIFQRVMSEERIDCVEATFITKDGKAIVVEGNINCQLKDGKPVATRGIFRNITERRQEEMEGLARLQRARRQQSAMVKLAVNDSIAQGDLKGAAKEITEHSAEALEVERAAIWLFSEDRQQLRCTDIFEMTSKTHSEGTVLYTKDYPRHFEVLETGRAIDAYDARTDPRTNEFTERYLIPRGVTSLLDAAIRVSGKIVGLVCHEHVGNCRKWVSDEITFAGEIADQVARTLINCERRRAEELRRQSEEKYRNLVETISDGVITSDLDENVLFANRASCKMLGYTLEELIGMNLREIVAKDELDKIIGETQKRKNKEDSQYELSIIGKDGQLRHIFVSATPLLDNHGNVKGTIGIFTDISDLKKAEKEKQELREKLTRSQRLESLGVLAGGVAHDLNNILGPLVAYPELIRMQLPPDSKIADKILKIENSAQRAAEVVQDLLTMARRGRYEMVSIDLNAVVESYLQSNDFSDLKSKSPVVNISMDLDRNIPNVKGSTPHLSKMVMNLIINAFDAMPHGGQLTIKTECKHVEKLIGGYDNIEKGKYVILTVIDTGVGIDEKYYKRLFEPFCTKKEMGRSGSGLGLAIVYGVVKDHNGYIDVKSEVNHGSDFAAYLPVVEITTGETIKVIVDIRGSEKILVVDDLEEQRELAASVLSSLGYDVEVAANGRKAVKYMRDNYANVVILDMIMEDDFDGLDTYREIIKYHPGQKAIIASGFSETDRVKEAERLGVGKYLRKPYTMQKLGKAIREVLAEKIGNFEKVTH